MKSAWESSGTEEGAVDACVTDIAEDVDVDVCESLSDLLRDADARSLFITANDAMAVRCVLGMGKWPQRKVLDPREAVG